MGEKAIWVDIPCIYTTAAGKWKYSTRVQYPAILLLLLLLLLLIYTLCHSNPQKLEESCLTGTLDLQGVTYMSCVEVFATGMKIKSSDQSPFWGLIKVTSGVLNQEHAAAIWTLTFWKASAQEPQKGTIKRLSTLVFANQNLDPSCKRKRRSIMKFNIL